MNFTKKTADNLEIQPMSSPLEPTFISDGAVGITDVFIMREHILGTQDKYTQHGCSVVTVQQDPRLFQHD